MKLRLKIVFFIFTYRYGTSNSNAKIGLDVVIVKLDHTVAKVVQELNWGYL